MILPERPFLLLLTRVVLFASGPSPAAQARHLQGHGKPLIGGILFLWMEGRVGVLSQ